MFEQTFVQTQAKTRKPWTVVVSLSVQCLAVAVLLLIPLLHTETLRMPEPPQPHLIRMWITQPPLPPQRVSSRASAVAAPAAPARRFVYVPPGTHTNPAPQVDVPSADPVMTGWSGPPGGAFGPSLTESAALPPRPVVAQPPPQTATKPVAAGPLKVGGDVEGAKLIYSPHPAYPQLAKAARSQGVVKLEAIIAADGSIRNLRIVSGPPLLIEAAINAVRQWRYHPTLLNGVAVEVLTEIDINFSLAQ